MLNHILTITQNSGIVENNIAVNLNDNAKLNVVGSSVYLNASTNGNDTWAQTGVITLQNYVNPDDETDVYEAYLQYVGADEQLKNGIINAKKLFFEANDIQDYQTYIPLDAYLFQL